MLPPNRMHQVWMQDLPAQSGHGPVLRFGTNAAFRADLQPYNAAPTWSIISNAGFRLSSMTRSCFVVARTTTTRLFVLSAVCPILFMSQTCAKITTAGSFTWTSSNAFFFSMEALKVTLVVLEIGNQSAHGKIEYSQSAYCGIARIGHDSLSWVRPNPSWHWGVVLSIECAA